MGHLARLLNDVTSVWTGRALQAESDDLEVFGLALCVWLPAIMDIRAHPISFGTEALTVARRQSAKLWELRAAMSMARLWRNQGKRQEAREVSLQSTAGSPRALTRSI